MCVAFVCLVDCAKAQEKGRPDLPWLFGKLGLSAEQDKTLVAQFKEHRGNVVDHEITKKERSYAQQIAVERIYFEDCWRYLDAKQKNAWVKLAKGYRFLPNKGWSKLTFTTAEDVAFCKTYAVYRERMERADNIAKQLKARLKSLGGYNDSSWSIEKVEQDMAFCKYLNDSETVTEFEIEVDDAIKESRDNRSDPQLARTAFCFASVRQSMWIGMYTAEVTAGMLPNNRKRIGAIEGAIILQTFLGLRDVTEEQLKDVGDELVVTYTLWKQFHKELDETKIQIAVIETDMLLTGDETLRKKKAEELKIVELAKRSLSESSLKEFGHLQDILDSVLTPTQLRKFKGHE